MAQTKFGGCKVAAAKLGISVEEYLQKTQSGLKWCFSCRDWLPSDGFSRDRTTHDGKVDTPLAEAEGIFNSATDLKMFCPCGNM
ncbi:hypothetical protein QUB11_27980 [Microcoleus sp. B6-A1]|uniref:hypothetical protein n=1 Tax=Microcoleus sp. B6-A1 TaxID=2818684 RepID=UPI002FCE96C1